MSHTRYVVCVGMYLFVEQEEEEFDLDRWLPLSKAPIFDRDDEDDDGEGGNTKREKKSDRSSKDHAKDSKGVCFCPCSRATGALSLMEPRYIVGVSRKNMRSIPRRDHSQ